MRRVIGLKYRFNFLALEIKLNTSRDTNLNEQKHYLA